MPVVSSKTAKQSVTNAVCWLAQRYFNLTKFLMPKLKTRRAAAKRFRRSGSGKIMRRKAFKNHLLERKSPARKRKLSKVTTVHENDVPNVELMMPYL